MIIVLAIRFLLRCDIFFQFRANWSTTDTFSTGRGRVDTKIAIAMCLYTAEDKTLPDTLLWKQMQLDNDKAHGVEFFLGS
jgi:hypothetical protein